MIGFITMMLNSVASKNVSSRVAVLFAVRDGHGSWLPAVCSIELITQRSQKVVFSIFVRIFLDESLGSH